MNKRPITVTILACALIAAGAVGLAYHLKDFNAPGAALLELILIAFVRLLAIVSGAFMLRGQDWARWLALAWIALHVGLSFLNSLREVAIHAAIFALFAWLLLRPEAWRFFRRSEA